MHVEISELRDESRLAAIAARLDAVLEDTRVAVADWRKMRDALGEIRRRARARETAAARGRARRDAGFSRLARRRQFHLPRCSRSIASMRWAAASPPGSASCATRLMSCSTACAISRRCRPSCKRSCAPRAGAVHHEIEPPRDHPPLPSADGCDRREAVRPPTLPGHRHAGLPRPLHVASSPIAVPRGACTPFLRLKVASVLVAQRLRAAEP